MANFHEFRIFHLKLKKSSQKYLLNEVEILRLRENRIVETVCIVVQVRTLKTMVQIQVSHPLPPTKSRISIWLVVYSSVLGFRYSLHPLSESIGDQSVLRELLGDKNTHIISTYSTTPGFPTPSDVTNWLYEYASTIYLISDHARKNIKKRIFP